MSLVIVSCKRFEYAATLSTRTTAAVSPPEPPPRQHQYLVGSFTQTPGHALSLGCCMYAVCLQSHGCCAQHALAPPSLFRCRCLLCNSLPLLHLGRHQLHYRQHSCVHSLRIADRELCGAGRPVAPSGSHLVHPQQGPDQHLLRRPAWCACLIPGDMPGCDPVQKRHPAAGDR